ncbi:MAG: preprotein translocase subunit YajC [Planctomycetota bacterium]
MSLLSLLIAQAAVDDRPFIQRLFDNPLLLPIGLLAIFYVTFWLPERRRKAEEAARLAAIKKNDRVITAGGLHAVVVAAAPDSDVVTLKIDEGGNTRVKINRTSISKVITPTKDKDNAKPNADADGDSST